MVKPLPAEAHLRVYLDTADIILIADAKAPSPTVARLRSVLESAPAAIVWSVSHPWDYYPGADEATKERIIDAMNEFPLVVGSYVDPRQLEPRPRDGPTPDLDLRRIVDMRDLLNHPAATEALAAAAPVVQMVHEAEQASLEAMRASRATPIAGKDKRVYVDALVSVVTSGDPRAMSNLIDELIDLGEKQQEVEIDPAVRAAIHDQLVPVVEMMKQAKDMYPELDTNALLQHMRNTIDPSLHETSPGQYAQGLLRQAKRRNVGRNSKRSDPVDLEHVLYLPYVDVFTTDRENVSILQKELPKIRKVRASILVRAGRLEVVADEVERLAGTAAV